MRFCIAVRIYLKAYKNIVSSMFCSVSAKTIPTSYNPYVLMLCERLCQIFWPLAFYQMKAKFHYVSHCEVCLTWGWFVFLSAAPHSFLCLNKSLDSPGISNKYLDIFSQLTSLTQLSLSLLLHPPQRLWNTAQDLFIRISFGDHHYMKTYISHSYYSMSRG